MGKMRRKTRPWETCKSVAEGGRTPQISTCQFGPCGGRPVPTSVPARYRITGLPLAPLPMTSRAAFSRVRLTAANGTPIKAYGQQKFIRILYCTGIEANFGVRFPAGIRYVDRSGHQASSALGHSHTVLFGLRSALGRCPISGINVVNAPRSLFVDILADFPEITDTSLASMTTKHGVECLIQPGHPSEWCRGVCPRRNLRQRRRTSI